MGHPLEHHKSLPDHMEPAGDVQAVRIVIEQFPQLGTKITGDIDDLPWTREALVCAKKTLVDYHAKTKVTPPAPGTLLAAKLVITVYASGSMSVTGDIGDLKLALAALDNALEGVKSESGRRARSALLPAKDANL